MKFKLSSNRLEMPRLLPITISVMAVLLVVRSGHLIFPATAETTIPYAEIAPTAAHSMQPEVSAKAGVIAPGATPLSTLQSDLPISTGERALLTDLRQRRIVLDAREASIASREVIFQGVEKRLTLRVDELSHLQVRLEALERQRKGRDEGSWRGLVKLYESMKPRDAAMIFNELDPSVLIPVLDRMKEQKAALVMSAMLPDRARQITTELALERKKENSFSGSGGN